MEPFSRPNLPRQNVPRTSLPRPSRRAFMLSTGTLLAASAVGGCSLLETSPATTASSAPSVGDGALEAPQLTEQVNQGKLPALDERLPASPMVVQPTERPGVYGGTWTSAILGPSDVTWLHRAIGYQPLVRWDREFTEVIPNVAESFQINDDATEFVFTLRAGLKWSDGEPFTADDLLFAQNDILGNSEMGGTDPTRAEKVDDVTVRFKLAEPDSLWIQKMASTSGMALIKPKHYLEQFHKKYNPDADQLADDEGFDDWVALIGQRDETWVNPDLPTLNPFVTIEWAQGKIVTERNPYFWKVDPQGRQLPYIDTCVFTVTGSAEVMLLKAASGEIDMQVRTFNTPANKPVLAKSREKGDYKFFDAPSTWMNTLMIGFNLTAQDPVKRKVFSSLDFRIGMSHAFDRDEIIKAVFQRQGEPWQGAPRKESNLYNERLAKQYTEYDPKLAGRHLDRAGLKRRDSEGFRLGPDGRRFTPIMMVKAEEPAMVSALEMAKNYWVELGVDVKVNPVDGALKFERVLANEHEVSADSGDGGAADAWLDPRWYLPISISSSPFGTAWAQWYETGGKDGTPPDTSTPAGKAAKQQLDLYDEIKQTPDTAGQLELMQELLEIAADTFWAIGVSLPVGGYGIVKNNFHNVGASMPDSYIYPTPGPSNPEQYFIQS